MLSNVLERDAKTDLHPIILFRRISMRFLLATSDPGSTGRAMSVAAEEKAGCDKSVSPVAIFFINIDAGAPEGPIAVKAGKQQTVVLASTATWCVKKIGF